MSTTARARTGPFHAGRFHAGEREIQARLGVRDEADRVGRIVSPILTPAVARLMAPFRLAVAASLDARSWPWASLIVGPPGFLHPVDERLLLVEARPPASDPLTPNLEGRPELGLLAIDLATRRRLRFNGRALDDPERGIFLAVDQVYGNCPKYIQARDLELENISAASLTSPQQQPPPSLPPQTPSPPRRSAEPSARQRALIEAADTFFIASHHPEGGPDASHRGGAPGFVHFLDARTLAFGDYPGNNMFNTLGNLAAEPRAGLLFLDFETGAALQVRGRARLDWDPDRVAAVRGARGVLVIFEIEETVETRGAGVRARLIDYSPANP